MEAIGKKELFSFLKEHGLNPEWINKDENGWTRILQFKVYDILYQVVWFCNESKLHIGDHKRSSFIPFRYVYYDSNFPLFGGNKAIGFTYTKYEKKSIFDREYPYEAFRIPLELENYG